MDEHKLLKLLYVLFLGALIATFFGVGINTFYPGPAQPDYPSALNAYGKELTREQIALQENYDRQIALYNKQMKPYNRNVSIIALSGAVVLLIISLAFEKHLKLLSDGIMVGGISTMIYSIGRGFASENSKFVFLTISIGLIVVLVIGYKKFTLFSPSQNKVRFGRS